MHSKGSNTMLALVALAAVFAAACSGGGGGSSTPANNNGTTTGTGTGTGTTSTQQVVRLALPQTSMGQVTDPTFGLVGGYTQQVYSQVLAFAPGAQIMIQNDQASLQHTLGDTGGTSSFPANSALSTTAAGGNTFSAGFQTGTLNPGVSVGPITLTAGTFYVGCAFHYQTNTMRTVLVVSAAAVPGPQATQPPGQPQPNPSDPNFRY
jgi:hypothetical protein